MPLHRKSDVKPEMVDEIYASHDLSVCVPKYKFPKGSQDPRHAYAIVHDELMLDGNSRQNLATFCQTWSEPQVAQLMAECIDKNMIDKDEYPQSAEIEARCVHMLADLWNCPESANTIGTSTTGSSEAAMLGAMALKWKWREKRRAQHRSADRPNLVTGPVQVCWHKFCRYWDVELREIPLDGDRLLLTPEQVVDALRREHHRGRAHTGRDVHLPIRAGQGGQRCAGRTARSTGARHSHPRRCGQRRLPGAFYPARSGVGFPPAAREVHQYLGAQVRAGAAGSRLGDLARAF